MEAVQLASNSIDPRIRRTRQMLFDALTRLLTTRDIEHISVADITEQATLNRATFYDHYSDKFALLEGLVEAQFQDLLSKQKVAFDGSCALALTGIALATCDFLAALQCSNYGQMNKHLEAAVGAVLRSMILGGLRNHPPETAIPMELIAATVSAAIYGAAREWVRTPNRMPVEQAVRSIFALVVPMIRPVDEPVGLQHTH